MWGTLEICVRVIRTSLLIGCRIVIYYKRMILASRRILHTHIHTSRSKWTCVMPKTPLRRTTIHRYEPSTRQQQAGVKELSVTQWHTTGVTKFEIRTHRGRHLGSGNSVADATEKLWKRLQQILPKEAREDKNVVNAFDYGQGSDDGEEEPEGCDKCNDVAHVPTYSNASTTLPDSSDNSIL